MSHMKDHSLIRLFAFPYGGAGASCYRTWHTELPSHIDLCPIQYPGRETRFGEPSLTRVEDLVSDFLAQDRNLDKAHFAFFGHSLGALVAFETVRELRLRSLPQPLMLLVSGYPAPHLDRSRPKVSHLELEPFFATLKREFDVSGDLLEEPQLAELVYRALRADFEAVEEYRFTQGEPIDSPILALGGRQDPEASQDQISAWRQHSVLPLRPRFFPGGHFFLHESKNSVLAVISAALEESRRNSSPHPTWIGIGC